MRRTGHIALSIGNVLMIEAVSTSEMSVNFYEITRRNIPESCNSLRLVYFSFTEQSLKQALDFLSIYLTLGLLLLSSYFLMGLGCYLRVASASSETLLNLHAAILPILQC
jgi:hypothetical protein